MKYLSLGIFLLSGFLFGADQYSILWTGDIHFGLKYRPEAKVLLSYKSSIAKILPFLERADYKIGNLETAVKATNESPRHLSEKKYIHNEISVETNPLFTQFNLFSLANNHVMDFGIDGLVATERFLLENNILYIGAGASSYAAAKPQKLDIHLDGDKTVKLAVFSCFESRKKYSKEYKFYAGPKREGVLSVNSPALKEAINSVKMEEPDRKVIVYIHWGVDYKAVNDKQREDASTLVGLGADLIIGHGAHHFQDIGEVSGVPVIYGLGNFVFNTPGRYRQTKCKPYSLAAFMDFSVVDAAVSAKMRFYPLASNNRLTNYQTRPVNDAELEDVKTMFGEGDKEVPTMKSDDLGYFFSMELPWYREHKVQE